MPSFSVADVSSNQSELGLGSGNTIPDALFGSAAFCLRSERQGVTKEPRAYVVTFSSSDASGNPTTEQVTVRVGHDQTRLKCPKVDPKRIVADDDPRCTGGGTNAR